MARCTQHGVRLCTAVQANEAHALLLGRLLVTAAQIAEQEGLVEKGYRLVINDGDHAGECQV